MKFHIQGVLRAGVLTVTAVGISACSSIIEGTTQEILVNTNPPGADCAFEREGLTIARVNPTPGIALVEKTKHDITVNCAKAGFDNSTFFNKSGVAGATFGNIILGGGIGWAIDSASGADNKYTTPINITLNPSSKSAPEPQPLSTGDEEKGTSEGRPVS